MDISKLIRHRQNQVKANIQKGFYADTPQNRKLGRVGQGYDGDKGTQKDKDGNITKMEGGDSQPSQTTTKKVDSKPSSSSEKPKTEEKKKSEPKKSANLDKLKNQEKFSNLAQAKRMVNNLGDDDTLTVGEFKEKLKSLDDSFKNKFYSGSLSREGLSDDDTLDKGEMMVRLLRESLSKPQERKLRGSSLDEKLENMNKNEGEDFGSFDKVILEKLDETGKENMLKLRPKGDYTKYKDILGDKNPSTNMEMADAIAEAMNSKDTQISDKRDSLPTEETWARPSDPQIPAKEAVQKIISKDGEDKFWNGVKDNLTNAESKKLDNFLNNGGSLNKLLGDKDGNGIRNTKTALNHVASRVKYDI